MGKTLEEYLAGLTGEQMRAAALKLWAAAGGQETGADTLEQWRAGQLRLRFEPIAQIEPRTPPPLTGHVIKTITVPAYSVADFTAAVRLGRFCNEHDLVSIIRQFAEEQVGLDEPVAVELVEFNRGWRNGEAIAWGVANGGKKPIGAAHLLGIAAGLPDEQRVHPIEELGSVRDGDVLCIHVNHGWRYLNRLTVEGNRNREYLVGFVSEPV